MHYCFYWFPWGSVDHDEAILVFTGFYWAARTRVIPTPPLSHVTEPHWVTWCWFPAIWIWEASVSFPYDEGTEAMRAVAEVTVVPGLGAFVAQLGAELGLWQACCTQTEL